MANSVVPKFTIMVGNSYGAGNYAMCGKHTILWLIFDIVYSANCGDEWPHQQLKHSYKLKWLLLKAKGKEITKEQGNSFLEQLLKNYNENITLLYSISVVVDGIIDPLETRSIISMGIEAANQSPIEKDIM